MTISDAELDGLLDCGDEVIDQLSELELVITIILDQNLAICKIQ